MKIAIVTSGVFPMPPVNGGAVENLVEFFIKQNENNGEHEIVIYSMDSKKARKTSENYKNCKFEYIDTESIIFRVSKVFRYLINRLPGVFIGNAFINEVKKRLKKSDGFDVIVIENMPLFGIVLRKITQGNLILHLHNDTLFREVKFARKILDSYNKVLCVSDYIRKRVNTIYHDEKVMTLYNGIDTSKFNKSLYKEDRAEVRKKFNILSEDIVILYTGRLHKDKGIEQLIIAFNKLMKEMSNIKLLIVGNFPSITKSSSQFERSINNSVAEASDRIIFTGYIDYNNIPQIYAISDIGVVPSIGPEAFALTALEHLSIGNPVVTTNSGGLPEVVSSECGIILKRDDPHIVDSLYKALFTLCIKKHQMEGMSLKARKHAVKFDYKIYCERFNELIKL
jgi:spore coat protein SA